MHAFLAADDSDTELVSELGTTFPQASVHLVQPGLVSVEEAVPEEGPLPCLVFARQWLPQAHWVQAESIRAWADTLADNVVGVLPDNQPWRLHLEPHYRHRPISRMGARAWHSATRLQNRELPQATPLFKSPPGSEPGRHRCQLIRAAFQEVLERKRRHLLRRLDDRLTPFAEPDTLVQVLLTAPNLGCLSVAPAPMPFRERRALSPFPQGFRPIASDPAAPSRAFAKLVEAEVCLGCAIGAGDTCVDLGAAPGSWTYVAIQRQARVVAVDRSPLRQDLMDHPHVRFQQGDAFRFQPDRPVDWLLCDVIAEPDRTVALLLDWLERRWCRHFVVTIKMKDEGSERALATLKQRLPQLTQEFMLTRLCANKKEICAFGVAML